MLPFRILTIALVLGALLGLTGCLSGDSARAKERARYWKRVEKSAATQSDRPKRYREEKRRTEEKRPKSYAKERRPKRYKEGKVARSRGALEAIFDHGWLVRVKPWERDILALDEMTWSPDPMQDTLRNHIYFSKESSLRGGSAGGGGCGCN